MPRRYANPPILEALTEFRFDPSSGWDSTIPGLLYEKLRASYVKKRQVSSVEVFISTQPNKPTEPAIQSSERVQFLAADEKDIIQVGSHLLSVNRLEPYSSWEEFCPKVLRAFGAYREVALPKALARVGVRYMNRIRIPKGMIQTEEYFDFYPFLGSNLPQMHGALLVGVHFPYDGEKDTLRLQLQTIPSPTPDALHLLLDLDYFSANPEKITFENVPAWLNTAHDRIEQVFEGCLKDTARKIFNSGTQGS